MTESLATQLDPQQHYRRAKRLLRHVWTHFQEDRSFEEAASLGYTSLLSLVPLLAVVFGIVAAFPVFDEWSQRLQAFIFDNFMTSAGEQIVPYIDKFLSSVSRLTLPGMLALLATALLLLAASLAFDLLGRSSAGTCDPDSLLQFHALWHALAAAAFGAYYVATTVPRNQELST